MSPELDPEQHTDPNLRAYKEVTNVRLAAGAKTLATLRMAVVFTMAALTAIGGFVVWLLDRAEHSSSMVESKLEMHLKDSAQVHRQILEDVHENQVDNRALYKAVLTRKPQERLEKPPRLHDDDGGDP